MSKSDHVPPVPGWSTLVSGIELITLSRLAAWDATGFIAEANRGRFNKNWRRVHRIYGRWMLWLAFSVGAESVVKGTFGLRNVRVKVFSADLQWSKALGMTSEEAKFVAPAIKKLATDVRDRDAHQYLPEVRDGDFADVADLYVPALNKIVQRLDVHELGREVQTRGKIHLSPRSFDEPNFGDFFGDLN